MDRDTADLLAKDLPEGFKVAGFQFGQVLGYAPASIKIDANGVLLVRVCTMSYTESGKKISQQLGTAEFCQKGTRTLYRMAAEGEAAAKSWAELPAKSTSFIVLMGSVLSLDEKSRERCRPLYDAVGRLGMDVVPTPSRQR